jgi:hypothetical protein
MDELNANMGHLCGIILTAETEVPGEKLSQSYFVHHKSHV